MGEKNTRLRRLLAKYPECAYCGGHTPATSVDHCPPISMFDNRHRPQGLEFPACADCHNGTRQMDLAVAVFSRLLGSEDAEPRREEISKFIRGFLNNHPEVALLLDTEAARPTILEGRTVYPIPIRDPERVGRIMDAFSARFGLAMYHDRFGRPAPETARIATQWYANVELFNGEYPAELLKAMGSPRTLSAGKFSVDAQFRYWIGAKEGETLFGAFAVARESFGILSLIDTADDSALPPDLDVLSPGFLKGFTI